MWKNNISVWISLTNTTVDGLSEEATDRRLEKGLGELEGGFWAKTRREWQERKTTQKSIRCKWEETEEARSSIAKTQQHVSDLSTNILGSCSDQRENSIALMSRIEFVKRRSYFDWGRLQIALTLSGFSRRCQTPSSLPLRRCWRKQ